MERGCPEKQCNEEQRPVFLWSNIFILVTGQNRARAILDTSIILQPVRPVAELVFSIALFTRRQSCQWSNLFCLLVYRVDFMCNVFTSVSNRDDRSDRDADRREIHFTLLVGRKDPMTPSASGPSCAA